MNQSMMTLSEIRIKHPSFLFNPNLELLLFGGKGGVGKTTSAVAVAMYLATEQPHRRILLASTDPAHSLYDCLEGCEPPDNLTIREICPSDSLKIFKDAYGEAIKLIASRGTFLDGEDISQFLSLSLPGLDEVMGIIEVIEALNSSQYDIVILDTAPTGHTLKLLKMPQIIQQWVDAFDSMMAKHRYMAMLYAGSYSRDEADRFLEKMANSIENITGVLNDTNRCEFVPVMIPEALSIEETERLILSLLEYEIPMRNIIINRVYEFEACPLCVSQRLLHARHLKEIEDKFLGFHLIKVPLFQAEISGTEALLDFARAVVTAGERAEDADKAGIDGPDFPPSSSNVGPSSVSQMAAAGCREDIPPTSWTDIQGSHLAIPSNTQCLLFAGKGGVGKTTISSAVAVHLAQLYPGKKIFIFSTDPAHSLSDCFGLSIGDRGRYILNNLYALEINPEKEFEGLKELYYTEIRTLFDTLIAGASIDIEFDRDVMENLMNLSPPGIDEVMALVKIVDLIEEKKYDLFIVDTAPTGHFIRLLELPDILDGWLKAFFNIFLKNKGLLRLPKISKFTVDLSKKIKGLKTLLTDASKTLFIPIAIPTNMSLEETKDIVSAVRRMGIPHSTLLLNMVIPDNGCIVCSTIRKWQEKDIQCFQSYFTDMRVCEVLKQAQEPRGIDELGELGKTLFGGYLNAAIS